MEAELGGRMRLSLLLVAAEVTRLKLLGLNRLK